MESNKKKVVLGLSGGVDSAVAAHLLMKQGFEVYGIYLKNWTERDEKGVCPAERDREDALRVAAKLGIPCTTVDYEKEYRERVFSFFLSGLEQGLTPNPDILCNPLVKFEALLEAAKKIGADFIATGHYARKMHKDGKSWLAAGIDKEKDQSYFLSRITYQQLEKTLFPIGDYTKTQVREIAKNLGLHLAEKESTSGICFIGERNFESFLKDRIKSAPGRVVTSDGTVVGEHRGLPFYTVGQRHGFGGGGGVPYYIAEKRMDSNTLVVAPSYDTSLFHKEITAIEPHWITQTPDLPRECQARIRYRQPLNKCRISTRGNYLVTAFEEGQRAVTPGQYIAFYDGEICLGSAMISYASSGEQIH